MKMEIMIRLFTVTARMLVEITCELDVYLQQPRVKFAVKPLDFWSTTGNNFPGIASQFAMHFQPFATHVFFMNRSFSAMQTETYMFTGEFIHTSTSE